MQLVDKNVLVFVSASIAAYKVLHLVRMIKKEGGRVRVVMTNKSLSFVGKDSFEAISQERVLSDKTEDWVSGLNHIVYAKWADVAVFAPMSANSAAKLANGVADSVYLSTALALTTKHKLMAPSANSFMINNDVTQHNILLLQRRGFELIESVVGELACGDTGNGAMASEHEIMFAIKRSLYNDAFWAGKDVIVTGGGSREPIDDIRYIGNCSSGIQASSLALVLYFLGANVVFISSEFPILLPKDVRQTKVSTSRDFLREIKSELHESSARVGYVGKEPGAFLFMAAAISDYIPMKKQGKLKRVDVGSNMKLELMENVDVLGSINEYNVFKVGFKAECVDEIRAYQNAYNMLDNKCCHAVCLNIVNDKNRVFGEASNTIRAITRDENRTFSGSKLQVSVEICNFIKNVHKQSLNMT